MKIKDIIQEAEQPWIQRSGFLQGALSGLTGLDFRDEDKVAKAIESIPEAEFQTKFGMTRQQFLDLPEDQQARVLASIRTIPPAPTPPAPTPTPPRSPVVTPGGVTIVRTSTGPGVPTHVRYRSQDFILVELPTGAEQWQNMMNGRPIPPTLAAFLTNELTTT